MQHQNIYRGQIKNPLTPFFYIIQHKITGMYYIGSKYGPNRFTNSSTFLTSSGYRTSSKVIKDIIKAESLNVFGIRHIRHFSSEWDARNWEIKFLRKVNAKNNPKCYNQSNGYGHYTSAKVSLALRKGIPIPESTKIKMSLAHLGKVRGPHPSTHKNNLSKSLQQQWNDPHSAIRIARDQLIQKRKLEKLQRFYNKSIANILTSEHYRNYCLYTWI